MSEGEQHGNCKNEIRKHLEGSELFLGVDLESSKRRKDASSFGNVCVYDEATQREQGNNNVREVIM